MLLSRNNELNIVYEQTNLFPGFKNYSPVMKEYFSKMTYAEKQVFKDTSLKQVYPRRVKHIELNTLNTLNKFDLSDYLDADLYICFGSSYIKGWLCDFLIKQKAINIHMGVSPYYRGSSCNFWACYDGNFHLVGATIHRLSEGLDSGDILYTITPPPTDDPFKLGMLAVRQAHLSIINNLEDLKTIIPYKQDRSKEIRYSRMKDFNEEIVTEYLNRLNE